MAARDWHSHTLHAASTVRDGTCPLGLKVHGITMLNQTSFPVKITAFALCLDTSQATTDSEVWMAGLVELDILSQDILCLGTMSRNCGLLHSDPRDHFRPSAQDWVPCKPRFSYPHNTFPFWLCCLGLACATRVRCVTTQFSCQGEDQSHVRAKENGWKRRPSDPEIRRSHDGQMKTCEREG